MTIVTACVTFAALCASDFLMLPPEAAHWGALGPQHVPPINLDFGVAFDWPNASLLLPENPIDVTDGPFEAFTRSLSTICDTVFDSPILVSR